VLVAVVMEEILHLLQLLGHLVLGVVVVQAVLLLVDKLQA